jgi:hypothetical protein
MFVGHCTVHGTRVLLGLESIRAMRRLPEGALVEFECSCGAINTELVKVRACR